MGSSSKMASPPPATPAPANTVPYGQTSPVINPIQNYLPQGDDMRSAQLGDQPWQTPGVPSPQVYRPPAAPAQDPNALKMLLAALMSKQGDGQFHPDRFGSSRGGGGLGGNYGTSGGGQSSHSYGRTSSGTRSSAHAGGGKWGGK